MQQRVVVWGTGNMGSTAIRSALAFPGLGLSGIITSADSKDGMDAAEFVGLDSPTGVTATTDVDAALAACDAVAYMASGDIRPEEAVNDIERCMRAGKHVVTPSLYSLYDPRSAPPEWVERLTGRRGGGRFDAARQRGRPGLGQRRARGDGGEPVHPHSNHHLSGDLRLLDLQPAVRGQGVLRFRRLDGRDVR